MAFEAFGRLAGCSCPPCQCSTPSSFPSDPRASYSFIWTSLFSLLLFLSFLPPCLRDALPRELRCLFTQHLLIQAFPPPSPAKASAGPSCTLHPALSLHHWLYLFTACLPHVLECQLCEGWDGCLLYSLPFPQTTLCLACHWIISFDHCIIASILFLSLSVSSVSFLEKNPTSSANMF